VPPGGEASGRLIANTPAPSSGRSSAPGSKCQATSLAREGALTEAVWQAVMGTDPVPSLQDRANALVFSFEATDFGDTPEWNFCEDSKRGKSEVDPGHLALFATILAILART